MTTWPIQKLSGLRNVVRIARGIPTARTMTKGEIPVLSVAALVSNKAATAFVNMTDVDDVGALLSEPGDVLVAVEGGSVGDSFFVTPGSSLFVPSQQAVTIRIFDQSVIQPQYLAAWIASPIARQQLLRLARGAVIQRISLSDLTSFVIPLAPIDVQNQIGESMTAFAEAITEHKKVLNYLNKLREIELTSRFSDQMNPGSAIESKAKPTP